MFVSDEEVAALRAEVERAKKDLARIRREEKEYERLRRERSWCTSFDRQGGDNSADRRGTAVPTVGSMWTSGVSTAADLEQSLTYVSRGIVPKLPVECSPSEYIAWEQRFEFFIANQGLRHNISLDAPEIAVISCTNNAYLFGQFGEELVLEHRQVWGYISDAAVDAPFEISLYKCHSISDALRMMREWSLPLYPAERHLLVAELERVQFMRDEESEIVQFILRQFPERPSHPYALVFGREFRDGGGAGVGVQRRDDHMVSRGGGMPWQQQQPLQHWPRDSGIPWQQQQLQHWSCDGGIPRQQQQLQHWFHDGGIPRQQQQQQQQQQWSRGGGNPHQHQRSSHTVPPARPARQQPSRGIHTSGRDGEHGRNPLSAPATEAVPDTSVFPAASSKVVAEAPTSSAGAASMAVPAAAPATGGTVFPTTSVGGAARAPAPADETAASKAASTASGTVPSVTPLRGAVGARESSAGAASSDAVSKAAPATSGTVPSATPLRGAVGARESSAGVASSDAVSKAAPATSGTVTSATPLRGAVGARESSAGAAPSDVAAEAFPLAVRYNINSSNSRGNGSSCSSNDTTSNHDSMWEVTYVGALLRPFDPGKGCQRDARIGVILGLDLPFDRGKA